MKSCRAYTPNLRAPRRGRQAEESVILTPAQSGPQGECQDSQDYTERSYSKKLNIKNLA